MDNVYADNITLLTGIENQEEKDETKIYCVFHTLLGEMQMTKKIARQFFGSYLREYVHLYPQTFFGDDEFRSYVASFLESLKMSVFYRRVCSLLIKRIRLMYEKGEYDQLTTLYTLHYMVVLAMDARDTMLREEGKMLDCYEKGYSYTPGFIVEDPRKYEVAIMEGINENILQMKKKLL